MFKSKVEDLHGHIFTFDGKYEITSVYPDSMRNCSMSSFNRDRVTDTEFNLICHGEHKFSYVTYENRQFYSGNFIYIGYEPKKDMRHKKELAFPTK